MLLLFVDYFFSTFILCVCGLRYRILLLVCESLSSLVMLRSFNSFLRGKHSKETTRKSFLNKDWIVMTLGAVLCHHNPKIFYLGCMNAWYRSRSRNCNREENPLTFSFCAVYANVRNSSWQCYHIIPAFPLWLTWLYPTPKPYKCINVYMCYAWVKRL